MPAVRSGNLVFTSGQLPMVDGQVGAQRGRWARPSPPEQGADLARIAAFNALAAIDALVGLDVVTRVVKVVGFVASASGFTGQPAVVNGARTSWARCSAMPAHARSAVGVAELPPGCTRRDRARRVDRLILEHPAVGQLRAVTETASVLLCDNPGS